jgi:hypothetical protein
MGITVAWRAVVNGEAVHCQLIKFFICALLKFMDRKPGEIEIVKYEAQ